MDKEKIKEIESLLNKDQKAIRDFKDGNITIAEIEKIQKTNTSYILGIIEKFGFPFKNSASEKAYKSAFLVIQHSGDVNVMDRIISVFLKASKEEIDKKELAYLIDRSRILKKLPQVYGTQYKQLPNNQIDFFQIEKAEDVDIRRAEFGMETLGEYKKRAESFLKT
jgi:hypothetical protein